MCTARATAARRVADDEFHQLAGCTVSAAVGAFQFVGVAAAQCEFGDLGELTGLGPGQRGGQVGSGILTEVTVGAGVQFGVVSPPGPPSDGPAAGQAAYGSRCCAVCTERNPT